jgi:hypothetical protein
VRDDGVLKKSINNNSIQLEIGIIRCHHRSTMSLIYTVPAAANTTSTSTSNITTRRHSIYIGGKSHAKSLEKLERWGISHILNVTPTKDTSIQVRSVPLRCEID